MTNEIKLNIGLDLAEFNAAMLTLKGTLLSIDISPSSTLARSGR
jgi:hypothetical protein